MKKFLYIISVIAAGIFSACDNNEADPNLYVNQTAENTSTIVLKGYEDSKLGFSVLQPDGFSSPIYIKDKSLTGAAYGFLKVSDEDMSKTDDVPVDATYATSGTVFKRSVFWVKYTGATAIRYIKLRIAWVEGNYVGIEYAISSKVTERPNSNSNLDNQDESTWSLEMPQLRSTNIYAPHYVTYGGEKILNYALEWNAPLKHAEWVAFSFDKTTSLDQVTRTDAWAVDPVLDTQYQVDNSYHTSDGFDRGHLCASEDRVYCTEANNQTFYFSNMSPQFNQFNTGFWEKMESLVQKWGRSTQTGAFDKVYVAKGGTLNKLLKSYTGTVKGNDGIYPKTDANGMTTKGLACPEYYFMAILAEKDGEYQAIAFLVKHDPTLTKTPSTNDIQLTTCSIDYLEEFSGIDFFCNLSDDTENSVEKEFNINDWEW